MAGRGLGRSAPQRPVYPSVPSDGHRPLSAHVTHPRRVSRPGGLRGLPGRSPPAGRDPFVRLGLVRVLERHNSPAHRGSGLDRSRSRLRCDPRVARYRADRREHQARGAVVVLLPRAISERGGGASDRRLGGAGLRCDGVDGVRAPGGTGGRGRHHRTAGSKPASTRAAVASRPHRLDRDHLRRPLA